MTFFDLFAGVGGFRRGLELAGHKCVGFCEWDKFATASYTSMHCITEEQRTYLSTLDLKQRQKEILKEEYRNGEFYSNDVRLIGRGNVPRADIWTFGAPCQDFSVAGHRKGLEGDRSSLVREVFRAISELEEADRPTWLIYENVKGMLSSNRGYDFAAILLEMEQLGYDIEWEVFNTKNFGIPQNRERVYTVGHFGKRGGKYQIFPLQTADAETDIPVAGIPIKIIAHRDGYRRNTQVFASEGVSEALSTCQGGGREHHTAVPVAFGIDYNKGGQERPIANCIKHRYDEEVTNRRQDGTAVCIPIIDPTRPNKTQNGRRFKDDGEEAFTLTAQDRHGVGISLPIKEAVSKGYSEAFEGDSINLAMPESTTRRGRIGKKCEQTLDTSCNQGTMVVKLESGEELNAVWYEKYQCYIAIRKLTPRECFRLQGWTDDYFDKAEFVNSDSQLYKQAGNGVTVDVVEEIGRAIAEVEKE